MATLQKIRNRAGILVAIIIGLALFAFILGDMFNSGNTLFKRKQAEIANIDGESVQYQDFQKRIEDLGEIYKMNSGQNQVDEETWVQIREQTWQSVLRESLMNGSYKKLGITVSADELYDMVQGSNVHPIVQQIFTNPNTGQVDKSAIIRFLKNLETGATPEQRNYWLYLEKQISEERIQSKYNNLIKKGLYATNEEAQGSLKEKSNNVNFKYVSIPYSSVSDSQVVITEKDLKDYYNTHQEEYKQQSTRKIEYVTFQVVPSAQDNLDAKNWIEEIKGDFIKAEDNVQFVNTNSDVSFEDKWFKKEDLPENLRIWIYDQNALVNDVLGPYFENSAYKLAKVHKFEMRPDSVQARHILLKVATQEELASKQALADSLKTVIEKGGNFALLAREFSTDQGSAVQGGDVGFFTHEKMVKPFADAAFKNKEGEVSTATSQFGIHIIQTTKRSAESRQVQVVFMIRNVVSSDVTYQKIYAEVSRFASENTNKGEFDAAVISQKLNKKSATLGENDRTLTGLENPRVLIRSAFEAKEGAILVDFRGSSIFELGNTFVIAVLVDVNEEGIAKFADERARIELAVLKQKKAEYIAAKVTAALKNENDMVVIAQALKSEVKTADNINFSSFSISGLGIEPALIGTATALEKGKISAPVKGNNAVFIVQVVDITKGVDGNVAAEQQRLTQGLEYRVDYQAYEAQKNAVKIVDKRSKFY